MKTLVKSFLIIAGSILAVTAVAAPPKTISYQGYLKDAAGKPVTAATNLTFRLYSSTRAESGPLWNESRSVTPANGVYSVELGTGTPLDPLPFDVQYFLGVTVESGSELLPRQPLTSAPYAIRAVQADSASSSETLTTSSQIVSTVPIGTPPLQVSSPTIVPNLNADMVDGRHAAEFILKAGDAMTGDLAAPSLSITGNLILPATTATSGIIKQGVNTLIHTAGGVTNFFAGTGAGNLTMSGNSNTASGAYALSANISGFSNNASGSYALQSNTSGNRNTASGAASLNANTTGSSNTASGFQALTFNTTGYENTASGSNALSANTTGNSNTAIGYYSLNQTTAGYNTAVGSNSLPADTTGTSNTAVGYQAMNLNTTGDYNVGLGRSALNDLSSGNYNTGLGVNAGNYLTTGSFNTFVGWNARPDSTTPALQYATAIGVSAIVSQDNSLVLGGTGTYAVNVGIGTSAPNTRLQVVGDIRVGTSGTNGCLKRFDGTAIAGICSSDERLKTNIRPFEPVLDKVTRLQPVHFTWKSEEFPEYHFGTAFNSGLIAQEVEQVFPEMVSTDEHGYKMVNYVELPYLMLAAIREQQQIIEEQKAHIEKQRQEFEARIARLEALLNVK